MKVLALSLAVLTLGGIKFQPQASDAQLHVKQVQVTLHVDVVPISTAVEALSKAVDLPMRVVGPAANETVFLHVDNRPLKEVMDELAKVTIAEWNLSTDGVYTLNRTDKLVRNIDQARRAKMGNGVTRWLDALNADLKAPFTVATAESLGREYISIRGKEHPTEAEYARMRAIEGHDPIRRALARCMMNTDLRPIYDLPEDGCLVYTTNPTAMQGLLVGGREALSLLQSDQQLWGSGMRKVNWKTPKGESFSPFSDFGREKDGFSFGTLSGLMKTTKLYPKTPAFASVVFERYKTTFVVRFEVDDETGNVLFSFEDQTYQRSDDEEDQRTLEKEAKIALKNPKPSEWSRAFWGQMRDEVEPIEPSKEKAIIAKFLDDPISNDIQKIGYPELFTAFAKQRQRSVIACLPDERCMTREGLVEMDWYWSQNDYCDFAHHETENWLEFYPKDYLQHWAERANRQSMKAFGRKVKNHEPIDVRTRAALHCGGPGEMAANDPTSLMEFLAKKSKDDEEDDSLPRRPEFLHIMASLTDAQMERLKRHEVIPYHELSSYQIQMVAKLVFGGKDDFYEGGKASNNFASKGASYELPRGIMDGEGLGADFVTDDLCFIHQRRIPEPHDYPKQINLADRQDRYVTTFMGCGTGHWYGTPSMFFEFRTQKRITLRCYLSKGHSFAGDFLEPIRKTDGKLRTYSELSPQVMKKLKESGEMMEKDDEGTQNSPPPPL